MTVYQAMGSGGHATTAPEIEPAQTEKSAGGGPNAAGASEQDAATSPPDAGPPDTLAHVYRSLSEFKILDHPAFADQRLFLVNYKKGERRFLWVSQGHIDSYKGTTNDFWMKFDMNSGQSQAMEEVQEEAYQKVQLRGDYWEKIKTNHVNNMPQTLIYRFWPVRVQLEGWPEEQRIILSRTEVLKDEDIVAGRTVPEDEGRTSKISEREKLVLASELLQHSETVILMFHAASGELQYANQTAIRFYQSVQQGLSSLQDVLSLVVWKDLEQKERILSGITNFKLDSERIQLDCRISSSGLSNAEDLWHQLHFIPARNPLTSELVVVVTQSDVTVTRKQGQELVQQQEISKQQEHFLSCVSHELRTPLHGIIGLSESLIQNITQNAVDPPQMLKTLNLVKGSGMRLANLVNDILDCAAARHGTFRVKREVVLLQEVAENVGELMQPLLPKDVTLINRLAEQRLPCLEGDSSRLNQIIFNLLGNAVKFTVRGSITLKARLLSEDEVLVEVVDTGCGIPLDKQKQVWQFFKQADMTTTRKYSGTGLGLSLVKELVEAHNGRVGITSCNSGTEHGTTVFFVLPVKQPDIDPENSHKQYLQPLSFSDLTPGMLLPKGSDRISSLHTDLQPISSSAVNAAEAGGVLPLQTPQLPCQDSLGLTRVLCSTNAHSVKAGASSPPFNHTVGSTFSLTLPLQASCSEKDAYNTFLTTADCVTCRHHLPSRQDIEKFRPNESGSSKTEGGFELISRADPLERAIAEKDLTILHLQMNVGELQEQARQKETELTRWQTELAYKRRTCSQMRKVEDKILQERRRLEKTLNAVQRKVNSLEHCVLHLLRKPGTNSPVSLEESLANDCGTVKRLQMVLAGQLKLVEDGKGERSSHTAFQRRQEETEVRGQDPLALRDSSLHARERKHSPRDDFLGHNCCRLSSLPQHTRRDQPSHTAARNNIPASVRTSSGCGFPSTFCSADSRRHDNGSSRQGNEVGTGMNFIVMDSAGMSEELWQRRVDWYCGNYKKWDPVRSESCSAQLLQSTKDKTREKKGEEEMTRGRDTEVGAEA